MSANIIKEGIVLLQWLNIHLSKCSQGLSKVFTTGQAKLNHQHYVIKIVDGRKVLRFSHGFLSFAVCCSKSFKPTYHFSTLCYYCTKEYTLCSMKHSCLHGRSIVFRFIICFLNQVHAGHRPARAWFLQIDPMRIIGMHVHVCVPASKAINN